MDISHRNHHHLSPLSASALLAAFAIFVLVQDGYLKGVFHKEILARIDPATVLTVSHTAPYPRRAIKPIVAEAASIAHGR
ncbi:hypothetical protein HGP17_05635 [Rhizobium sp. P38BS-XIX]|uniref:hypothetical protein n=1 Tax=Rhizobium sp. P38BS-XIX TaxID=2726740 RepID=UPI001456743B|nr:hypothetical protein [Rhizobium sp. P38BS-XIX]NLR96309.1 hypothetical protein [Rhizobium sp. P38BS-XIX]